MSTHNNIFHLNEIQKEILLSLRDFESKLRVIFEIYRKKMIFQIYLKFCLFFQHRVKTHL